MNFSFFRVLIVTICLNFIETFSQSSDLLIQQYRKHNFDIEYYKKFNSSIKFSVNKINLIDLKSEGSINYDLSKLFYYRFKKSIALGTGIEYQNYSFEYSNSIDKKFYRIKYISFPLFFKIVPSKKINLNFGFSFNKHISSYFSEIDKSNFNLDEKSFLKNSTSLIFSLNYFIWKKFFVSPSFKIQNNSKNTFEKEINNFRVFSFGVGYKLFSDIKK